MSFKKLPIALVGVEIGSRGRKKLESPVRQILGLPPGMGGIKVRLG